MKEIGTNLEVFEGRALMTRSGDTARDLILNKKKQPVSRKKSLALRARLPAMRAAMCEKLGFV